MPDASSVELSRRILLGAAPAAFTLALAGCGTPQLTPAELVQALQARLDAFDEPGLRALFYDQPGTQALATRFFVNLTGAQATPTRRLGLDPDGRLHVEWAFPSEPTVVSVATMALILGKIANLVPASTGTEWLDDPLVQRAEPHLVVSAADNVGLTRWWQAAETALAALAKVTPPGRNWTAPLVLLAPADLTQFARYAGDSADRTAAVTVVPGTAASHSIRVVVNPRPLQPGQNDPATIAHEAVHAFMASPRLTRAPRWLLEGIAEQLTAQAFPAVASQNRRLAKARQPGGAPQSLPEVDGGDETAYALAQLAVLAMVEQVGWQAVFDEVEARQQGSVVIADARVLGWYRAVLARL